MINIMIIFMIFRFNKIYTARVNDVLFNKLKPHGIIIQLPVYRKNSTIHNINITFLPTLNKTLQAFKEVMIL